MNFEDRDSFPLRNVGDVLKLFDRNLNRRPSDTSSTDRSSTCSWQKFEPNLAFLSIVAGAIENNMCQLKSMQTKDGDEQIHGAEMTGQQTGDVTCTNLPIEPPLEWSLVESLMMKFDGIIRGFCDVELLADARRCSDLNDEESHEKNRKLIKHVADIIWNTLSKAQYKDRPHLQSIYSYLTGNKLDCFGVAFAVVASCQLLEVRNVHLALSEDHAWVVFGKDGTETAEVTWHGKGNEDKRGRPVDILKAKTSWLYLAGQPVVCDRYLEVAAIVSSINPGINSNFDSLEVGALQQELLWMLYDKGYLKNYPMALGNLGDLEEISPSIGRPSCERLFKEAIVADETIYQNHHVYPYTYQAGYYYRTKKYDKALEIWAKAADVIKLYRYSKDDEEIYKEFMEIANDLIPSIVKSDSKIPTDPKSFAAILRFYDGLCSWEEGSPTPVLHIGWAKHMVATCLKFDSKTRAGVEVEPEESKMDLSTTGKLTSNSLPTSSIFHEDNNNYYKPSCVKQKMLGKGNNNCDDGQMNNSSASLCNLITKLSSSCAFNLLNIDFLLGKARKPFVDSAKVHKRKYKHLNPEQKSITESTASDETTEERSEPIYVKLHSAKMRGLRSLLCAEKLNTSAITLQMTAQSQTDVTSHKKGGGDDSAAGPSRSKRSRRDT